MDEHASEASRSQTIGATSKRFAFGIRHLLALTTIFCLLLVSRQFGALPYLLELIFLGGVLAWMVHRLLRALRVSREQLFRTAVWMSGLNVVYGLGVFMLLLPEFYSPTNHGNRETVNNLIWIFIWSIAAHWIILAEFFMFLYMKQTSPKRSLLMALLNLSPFLLAFVYFVLAIIA